MNPAPGIPETARRVPDTVGAPGASHAAQRKKAVRPLGGTTQFRP